MKFLAIMFILFPMVVTAQISGPSTSGKGGISGPPTSGTFRSSQPQGFINCNDIPHMATCRAKCLSNEYEIREMKVMSGDHKGQIVHTFCTIISVDQVEDLNKKGIMLMKGNKKADFNDMRTNDMCCTREKK